MLRLLLVLFTAIAALYAAVRYWPTGDVRYGAGRMVAPAEPLQQNGPEEPLGQVAGYAVTKLAGYEITARVLSTRRYRYEPAHELVPIDLAVGWGRMSDEAVLDRLELSQGFRFFFYRWHGEQPPIPQREIACHAANVHVIPADPSVAKAVFGFHRGAVVKLSGDLVRATKDDAGTWVSSLVRDDVGPGACEVLYARTAEVVPPADLP